MQETVATREIRVPIHLGSQHGNFDSIAASLDADFPPLQSFLQSRENTFQKNATIYFFPK